MAKYDVIVVGGRCAGAPTAMLLARAGLRVLVVDRDTFPSDTLSTHFIHQPGVARLKRWGLLDAVAASNCPPVRGLTIDFGPLVLRGAPQPYDGMPDAFAPRRRVLDKILLNAAAAAGVEVREGFAVTGLEIEGGVVAGIKGHHVGTDAEVTERAALVIGADGMHSFVARAVEAPTYEEFGALTCAYYTYWDGVPVTGAELYIRPGQAIILGPTNDGLTLSILYWPATMFHEVRADIEGHVSAAFGQIPDLAARVSAGTRAERFYGTGDLPFFFRRPFGPGWALVGDAGYHQDPITADGISDAFRDAEFLAEAVITGLAGRDAVADALAGYEMRRNQAAMPLYHLTRQFASLEPPPPEMQQLLGALAGNPTATSQFLGTITGAVPVPEFFAPDNISALLAGAP